MPGAQVGLREDDVDARDAGVRDEALRAVEYVLVALEPGFGAHRGRVGARAGLGQRVRRKPLAARQAREVPLLLFLRAVVLDREGAQLLQGEDEAGRGTDLRDLLDRDEHHERPRPGAPEALLEGEAEDLVLAEELDHVRELARGVDLGGARRDALARERPDELADLALLVGERLVPHARILVAAAREARSLNNSAVGWLSPIWDAWRATRALLAVTLESGWWERGAPKESRSAGDLRFLGPVEIPNRERDSDHRPLRALGGKT